MAATAAAIVSAIAAVGGTAASLFGGSGSSARTAIAQQELDNARQQAINAAIAGAETGKLGRSGYSDSSGNGFRYDPGSNTWISTLGPSAQNVQTSADNAQIERNTTDLRQAQGANRRADINAAEAQPLIDAARRRYADFKPTSGDELTSLLSQSAITANNETYRPLVQDTLRQFTRSGSAAGPVLANIGKRSGADLRQGLIDARLKGMTGADSINNTRRQGLQSDLTTAMAAGTPQFQYPTVAASTNNKDMLAALTNRATGAAYANALGQQAVSGANSGERDASKNLLGTIPSDSVGASNTYSALGQVKDFASSDAFKSLYGSVFDSSELSKLNKDITSKQNDPAYFGVYNK